MSRFGVKSIQQVIETSSLWKAKLLQNRTFETYYCVDLKSRSPVVQI